MVDASHNYDKELTLERLYGWHSALFPTGRSGLYKTKVGGLRDDRDGPMQVVTFEADREKVYYQAPPAKNLPIYMEKFLYWINNENKINPIIKTAIAHLWFITLHPFEDGNGRTARLLSGYIMDISGYGFNGIGSLEEYFAYDVNEYYESIQMGLPALYYSGRDNPPHPEVWINYFLRMVLLYSKKICELSESSSEEEIGGSLSYLKGREKELLSFLIKKYRREFTPIEVSREIGVTNKTVINRLSVLVKNGFVEPLMVNQRIRSYKLSDFTRDNVKIIKKMIS